MKEINGVGDEAIKTRFDSVVFLIRGGHVSDDKYENENSGDMNTNIPDSVKLKLYGYYKVATNQAFDDRPSPSIFSVVARAKYNAWKDAAAECARAEDAMKAYIELAEIWFRKLGIKYDMKEFVTESKTEIETGSNIIVDDSTSILKYARQQSKKFPFSFLPQPIIARGTLDISYRDLFYALQCCILPNIIMHRERGCEIAIMDYYQLRIEQLWIEKFTPLSNSNQKIDKKNSRILSITESTSTPNNASIVVGLSVRSLLDLYLSVKSYPTNSEIIIIPPLNIKGIIDIITYTHNLKVVPIDLPDQNVIGIDLNRVREAITKKTVAIMIVHPFGKMAISTPNMKYLSQEICKKYNLDLLEDCAECFSANTYNPNTDTNQYATASFYSFGFIKTATSLGGAIAYFPSEIGTSNHNKNLNAYTDDIPTQMKDLQNVRRLAQTQSNILFLSKVMKAMLIKFFSDTPHLVGITAQLCQLLGRDYGEFVTSLIKAFPDDQSSDSKTFSFQHNSRMTKIRQTPSIALLALLHRRLQHYQYNKIQQRIKRCEEVVHLMRKKDLVESERVQLPQTYAKDLHNNELIYQPSNLFWLFPILVDKPDEVTRVMMEHGFDVPQGTSQLGCIESFLMKDRNNEVHCTYAREMMKKVLYLPIASKKDISSDEIQRMVAALDLATSQKNQIKEKKSSDRFFPFSWEHIVILMTPLAIVISPNIVKCCLFMISMISYIGLLGCIVLMLVTLLRLKVSPLYLASKTFAKYNSISSKRLINNECTAMIRKSDNFKAMQADDVKIKSQNEHKSHENIFKSLDLYQITANITPQSSEPQSAMAFVTGSTGFIGTLLIRNLLLNRNDLNIPGGIILLCRSKKNLSAKERIHKHIMKDPIFSFLSQSDFDKYIHVVEGNITHPNLGMDEASLKSLSTYNVTHVFHVAASVSFIQPLADAAESNITSALQIQSLARNGFRRPAKYIHFSTAFVHGNSVDNTVTEKLFDFSSGGKYDPYKLYESIMGTQSLAWDAYHHFKFPNTYTFTKSICEHLILQNDASDKNTIIVRPSIVGPSILFPFEGWCGHKPSTVVGAGCLYLKFQWSLWCFKKTPVPVVPVDVVVQFTIKQAFNYDMTFPSSPTFIKESCLSSADDVCARSDSSDEDALVINSSSKKCVIDLNSVGRFQKQIYNVAWDLNSPASHAFNWFDFAASLTETGRVHGYFGSLTACTTLNIAQKIKLSKEKFEFYHSILVRKPFSIALWIIENIGSRDATKRLRGFSKLLDVPLLFYHFSTGDFKFESELIAPPELDGERYMMNCILAAEDFISKQNKIFRGLPMTKEVKTVTKSSRKVIGGRNHFTLTSDLWWALTQPQGNIFIRIAGFLMIKILRCTATELTVDLGSFCSLENLLSNVTMVKQNKQKPHIILAPTHRSLFDFLVLSFIFFSIPEIGIQIPFIAAADDFKCIPFFGWFAEGAQAFFLQRGTGKKDPRLNKKISQLKSLAGNNGAVIEVFLEGKRSRDRRFVPAKTGLLR